MSHRAAGIASTVAGAVPRFYKAIFAAVTQAISGLILVTVGGVGIGDIITNQWLVIILSVVIAGGGVYGLTNKS